MSLTFETKTKTHGENIIKSDNKKKTDFIVLTKISLKTYEKLQIITKNQQSSR